jgi:hypothetical protein
MAATTEDTALIRHAIAYTIELYRELTDENGAPSLGTQNQVVDLILADPHLRAAIEAWARTVQTEEATTAPPRRLPQDDTYRRVSEFMRSVMEKPVFVRDRQTPH